MKYRWISMLVSVVLVIGLAVLPAPKPVHAATCTSTGTGNWSGTGIWSCDHVPGVGDDVTIATEHTVTVNTNTASLSSLTVNGTLRFDDTGTGRSMTVTGDVTINSGGTLDVATGGSATTHSLTIGGNLTNDGTFDCLPAADHIINVTFNGSSGTTQTVSGSTTFYNLTLDNSGATTNFGTSSTTIANTLDAKAGTMSAGTSTITFTGAAGSITGTRAKEFYDLVIDSGASIANSSGGNLTVKHSFTNNGTFTQDSGLTTYFNKTGTTIALYGSGSTTFGSVDVRYSTTLDAGSHSFTVTGSDFKVSSSGGTFNGNTATVTFNGTTTINCTGTINFNNLTISNALTGCSESVNVAGNWTNNGTFTAGTGTVTFNGTGVSSYGGSSTTTFNNLTINSGATLDVGANTIFNVSGTMTNNGTLKQTRTVNQSATTSFLNVSTTKYYGVDITLGSVGDMGSTVVSIKGNQACNTTDTLVHRCFDIAPTTAKNATIKFWYLNSEANGNTPSSMKVYRWTDSAWSEETGDYTRGTSGSYEWVQVTDVDEYSVFGLDDGSPTAVTLSSFAAGAVNDFRAAMLWPLAALASAAALTLAGLLWARQRRLE